MKFQAYINRQFQTSSRILTLEPSERTAQDQAPPHPLTCYPTPNPSSMTSPKREAGETLRIGSGIVYPLQPRVRCPHARITVDAALPEPAAFQRQDLPPTVVDIGSPIQSQKSPAAKRHASRKPSRKRRRNRSTAVFRPAKHSSSRGHWCD